MADASATLAGGEGPGLPRTVGKTAERPAKRDDFTREGRNETVDLASDLRASATKRLRERVGVVRDLAKDEARLGTYDRLLLGDRGEELVDKFEDSTQDLTADDMALAWAVVSDELIQKEDAVGNAYSQAEWLTNLNARLLTVQRGTAALGSNGIQRGLSRLAGRVHGVLTSDRLTNLRGANKTAVTPSGTPELTSDYIQKLRYTDQPAERVAEDIIDLHRLKVSFEQTLGIPNVDPDVWQQPDFRRGQGHRLHDTVVDRQERILTREHNGMTFAELQRQDPVAAERVRHKAVQEGLMHFSDGMARELLKAERPEVDTTGIDASISQIGTPLEGLAKEQAERSLERTRIRWQQAMDKLDHLEDSRDGRLQAITTAQEVRQIAGDELARLGPLIIAEVGRLAAEIATQSGYLATATAAARPGITAEIARLTAERNTKIAEQTALHTRDVQAAAALARANDAYNLLDAAAAGTPAAPVPGSILHAQAEIVRAGIAIGTIKNQLRGTPDAEQRAVRGALERWKVLAEPTNYEKIIDTRFTQGHQGRYQRGRLADTTVGTDGEMVGAELIREHIFGVTDAANGYRTAEQRERGRRMISDEAIARSIIEVFRVDIHEGPIPINALLTNVTNDRGTLATAEQALRAAIAAGTTGPALALFEAAVTTARGSLRTNEQTLVGRVLPMLRDATNFDTGDVLRFVIHEGLLSAARGEPYLAVPTEYQQQQPERRLTAEAILGENMGGVSITEEKILGIPGVPAVPVVQWEGSLAGINTGPGGAFEGFTIAPDTDLNFRIRTTFRSGNIVTGAGRDEVGCVIAVETDEALLQSLPDNAPVNCPPEILRQFYDRNRVIRTRDMRLLRDVPTWIDIPAPLLPVNPGTPDILAPINGGLSPDASQRVSVATANDILNRSPQERQRIVRGFREVPLVSPTLRLSVTFDNDGQFWIQATPVLPGGTLGTPIVQELDTYFNAQSAAYELLPVTSPGAPPGPREQLRDRLQQLQEHVGREILRTQVRR